MAPATSPCSRCCFHNASTSASVRAEAAQGEGELAVEQFMHDLGNRIAAARDRHRLDMQAVFVEIGTGETALAGGLLDLVQGQTGADHGAVMLVLRTAIGHLGLDDDAGRRFVEQVLDSYLTQAI